MTLSPPNAELALRATGLLAEFNRHGILASADVHIASRLASLLRENDETVILALALTVRASRHGSVVVNLATVAQSVSRDDETARSDSADLPWPELDSWSAACLASPLVNASESPLRQRDTRLWLTRYDAEEQDVADGLRARAETLPDDLDLTRVRAGLDRLFPSSDDADQRLAAAICSLPRLSVLTGGPGTGKTTTVSRLLALLREQHPHWRIALAAPTGKAAARLGETVARSLATLPEDDRLRLAGVESVTLHRLLGWHPGPPAGFRYGRANRLPFDVVVVDEASMVSLTTMSRLLDALRPTTRLVLLGDPDQLSSIEAGAVLADIVGADASATRTVPFLDALSVIAPEHRLRGAEVTALGRVRDGIAELTTNHRFGTSSAISLLASAIRSGRADDVIQILRAGDSSVEWIEIADTAPIAPHTIGIVQDEIEAWARALQTAASRDDHEAALEALDDHRLLCAHRRGPRGVQRWDALARRWAAASAPVSALRNADLYFQGEPLVVTANNYELGIFNGDTGVVTGRRDAAGHPEQAWFSRAGEPLTVPLARLGSVQPAYAMTVHRTQGSQFKRVTLILPTATSPLATREALYTAVTRAATHVRVIGSLDSIRTAVITPISRATGLRDRLGEDPGRAPR
jgi:exodeoxyribonuclease V alpha subunit